MATYELMYFNGRGRGELARMLFAAAGKEFTDKRLEFSEWPDCKKNTPKQELPVLTVTRGKGKSTQYCESMAIARFLAREFDLYGKDNDAKTLVDEVLDTCVGLFNKFVTIAFTKDEAEKKKLTKEYEEGSSKQLQFLEDLAKQQKSDYIVGDSVTAADLYLYVFTETAGLQGKLEKYPNLDKSVKKVAQLPKISAYLKKRPVTQF